MNTIQHFKIPSDIQDINDPSKVIIDMPFGATCFAVQDPWGQGSERGLIFAIVSDEATIVKAEFRLYQNKDTVGVNKGDLTYLGYLVEKGYFVFSVGK